MPRRPTRLLRLVAKLAPAKRSDTGGAATRPRSPRTPGGAGADVTSIRDPWHLILLENVVYLADDAARGRAFATLRRRTALDPEVLQTCPDEILLEACGEGRMAANQVRKLRRCAELFATVGDPRDLVRLPLPRARRALRRFPGIGEPGADKLLLLAGAQPVLALDSNALRVLLRLGYGTEARAYAKSYRSAQTAAMAELPDEVETLVGAHHALRAHGQQVCRRTAPQCEECALRRDCPSAAE
ncbi:MAG: hypothetical protein R3F56_01460 [Planctomycetota bacterium]